MAATRTIMSVNAKPMFQSIFHRLYEFLFRDELNIRVKKCHIEEASIMVDWKMKRDKNGLIDLGSFLSRQDAVQYEAKVLIPGSWKAQAGILLRAADTLFRVYDEAETRKEARDQVLIERARRNEQAPITMDRQESEDYFDTLLLPVFLLLMGYAIENLIKGIMYGRQRICLKRIIET
jgi:hypothetical protein